MLVQFLKDKGLIPLTATVAVAVAMLLWICSYGASDNIGHQLLGAHWLFGQLLEHKVMAMLIGAVLIVATTVLARLKIKAYTSEVDNRNIRSLVLIAILLTQPGIVYNTDVMAAALLIQGAFLLLFSIDDQETGLSKIFHAGLLMGVACLLFGQSVMLTIALFFALFVLRTWNWKEWAVPWLGMVMTIVFVFLAVVWADSPFSEFQTMVQTGWHGQLSVQKVSAGHIVLLSAFVVSVATAYSSRGSGSVAEWNCTLSLIGWILSAVLSVWLLEAGWQNGIVLAAFPLSVLMARAIGSLKIRWLADVLLAAILLAPLLSSLWRFSIG